MWRRTTLLIVCVAALASAARAQVPPPAEPAPAESETPPIVIPLPEPAPATEELEAETPEETTPPPIVPKAKPPKPPPPKPKAQAPVEDVEQEPETRADSSKPPAFRCFVRDVMAFYDRTHVRCYNKARGKFVFFAVDTGQPIAATVLYKALTGMQSGKPVTITFAPGSDLNPSNCAKSNCRRLLDIKN